MEIEGPLHSAPWRTDARVCVHHRHHSPVGTSRNTCMCTSSWMDRCRVMFLDAKPEVLHVVGNLMHLISPLSRAHCCLWDSLDGESVTCSATHAACRSRLTVRRRKRQGAEEEVGEETEEEEIKHGKSQRSGSQDTPLISTKTSRDRELRGMSPKASLLNLAKLKNLLET